LHRVIESYCRRWCSTFRRSSTVRHYIVAVVFSLRHHHYARDGNSCVAHASCSARRPDHMTLIVIGIDGGGSKTRAMVADEHGGMVGDVVGTASDVRPGRVEASAAVIADVESAALASC